MRIVNLSTFMLPFPTPHPICCKLPNLPRTRHGKRTKDWLFWVMQWVEWQTYFIANSLWLLVLCLHVHGIDLKMQLFSLLFTTVMVNTGKVCRLVRQSDAAFVSACSLLHLLLAFYPCITWYLIWQSMSAITPRHAVCKARYTRARVSQSRSGG